jgi:hypothetical protein
VRSISMLGVSRVEMGSPGWGVYGMVGGWLMRKRGGIWM